jgi:Tfp pilus assembly protein PilF
MSKYYLSLEYEMEGVTISEDELNEIVAEANAVIKNENADEDALVWADIKKAQGLQLNGGYYEKSRPPLKKALRLRPNNPQALLAMGNVYQKDYDYEYDAPE